MANRLTAQNMAHRYMIVEHKSRKLGFDEQGRFKNQLPIHHLLGPYHWVHLDSNHVLVTGHFAMLHMKHIEARADVSVLPSLYSSKTVSKSVKKSAHWSALQNKLQASDDHTTIDIAETAAIKLDPLFAPPI